jgi:hypothetical protein
LFNRRLVHTIPMTCTAPASIRSLIVRAIEQAYSEPKKGEYVTGPLVTGPGKPGPAFPEDENPHDLVFS